MFTRLRIEADFVAVVLVLQVESPLGRHQPDGNGKGIDTAAEALGQRGEELSRGRGLLDQAGDLFSSCWDSAFESRSVGESARCSSRASLGCGFTMQIVFEV